MLGKTGSVGNVFARKRDGTVPFKIRASIASPAEPSVTRGTGFDRAGRP